jgi:hypothetical protein
VVATTAIRTFHAMVPVIDHLEQSGVMMSVMVDSGSLDGHSPGATVVNAFLSKWSDDARYLSKLMHEQARLSTSPSRTPWPSTARLRRQLEPSK